jgi:hypothetical protein
VAASVRRPLCRKISGGFELEAARLAGPNVTHAALAHPLRPGGGDNINGAIWTELKRLSADAFHAGRAVQIFHGTSSLTSPVPATNTLPERSAVKSATLTFAQARHGAGALLFVMAGLRRLLLLKCGYLTPISCQSRVRLWAVSCQSDSSSFCLAV